MIYYHIIQILKQGKQQAYVYYVIMESKKYYADFRLRVLKYIAEDPATIAKDAEKAKQM
jgi:hypothetical protein